MDRSSEWIPAARVDEIPVGFRKCVLVGETRILVFNLDGEFHAIEDRCTHLNLSMCNGELFGTEFVCPWHGAAFDITTGKALGLPARGDVHHYPLRVEDGCIEIQIMEDGPNC